MVRIESFGHVTKSHRMRMLTILCPALLTHRFPDQRITQTRAVHTHPYGVGAALFEDGSVNLVRVPLHMVGPVSKMAGRAFEVTKFSIERLRASRKPGVGRPDSPYSVEVLTGKAARYFPKRTQKLMVKAEDLLDQMAGELPLFASFEAAAKYFRIWSGLEVVMEQVKADVAEALGAEAAKVKSKR